MEGPLPQRKGKGTCVLLSGDLTFPDVMVKAQHTALPTLGKLLSREPPGALSALQKCSSNRRRPHCPTCKRKGGTRDPGDAGGRTSLSLSKKITLVTLLLPYLNWRLVRIFLLNTSDFSGKNTQQSNSVDSCFEVGWLPPPGSGDHSASDGSYCARNRRTAAVSPAWWEHLSFVTPVTEATGLFCLSPPLPPLPAPSASPHPLSYAFSHLRDLRQWFFQYDIFLAVFQAYQRVYIFQFTFLHLRRVF